MSKRISILISSLLALTLCLSLIPVSAENSNPVAENFEFETYRNVSFGGELAAVDPDGDTLSFEIVTEPSKGTVIINEDGSFVYTPLEGKKGKDYFGYAAVDSEGNRSNEATVIIKISKQKTDVSYADMAGSADYCSAVKLAECGAFVGKQINGEYFFEPEATVTRCEFLSMCLVISGKELLDGVVSTGFTDDGDIPDWEKSCVSTAVKCGIIKGYGDGSGVYFKAESEITKAEAMVMLNRSLGLSDVSYIDTGGSVPTFAAQSAANLTACDIISDTASATAPLTRAEAAAMLASAMELIESR